MIKSFGDMTLGTGIVRGDNMDSERSPTNHVAEFLDKPLAFAAARRSADVAAVLMAIGSDEPRGQVLRAVSQLLSSSPQFWPFARHLFEADPDPLQTFVAQEEEEEEDEPSAKKMKKEEANLLLSDSQILESCLSLLRVDPGHFGGIWKWTVLYEALATGRLTADPPASALAVECLAAAFGLSERTSLCMAEEFVPGGKEFFLEQNWKRMESKPASSTLKMKKVITEALRSEKMCSPFSIPLLKHEGSATTESGLVLVPEMEERLRGLTRAVSAGQPVVLSGPSGSGKTSLVEHLAAAVGRGDFRGMKRVQISDALDGRGLLGSLVCSGVPGNFEWKPGVLAEAVENGDWILFEDFDRAPADVVAVVNSLAETGEMHTASDSAKRRPSPGFQMLFTQSGAGHECAVQRATIIRCEPYSSSSMSAVATSLHPSLSAYLPHMVAHVSAEQSLERSFRKRSVSIREEAI